MRIKIATIFEDFTQVHWAKDVGIIPQVMGKLTGSFGLIIRRNASAADAVKNNTSLKTINEKVWLLFYIKALFILLKEKIGLLNVYHLSKKNLLWAITAKCIGIRTYLKLDMDINNATRMLKYIERHKIRTFLTIYLQVYLFDYVTIEDTGLYNILKSHRYFKKIKHLPNCIWDDESKLSKQVIDIKYRENVILVVGRIGSFQKNHEIILTASRSIKWHDDWKIKFIGDYSPGFFALYLSLLAQNPELKSRVELCGGKDVKDVYRNYLCSKIYLNTSRWEGFSLAMIEAAYMGCHIITTNVGGAVDITNNGHFGDIVTPDEQAIVEVVQKFIDGERNVADNYISRVKYIHDNFEWTKRCNNLFITHRTKR